MSKHAQAAKKDELFDEELVDHVVTKEDLENNPELVKEGIKVGETIQIPKEDETPDQSTPPAKVQETAPVKKDKKKYIDPEDSKIPEWAKAKDVKITKEDEKNFFPKDSEKFEKEERPEKTPSWSQAEIISN